MLRLAYISLLSRYIPPSAIGCVADFSPHKGKFGEAAIQQALCYRGYTSSEETSDVVLERVIARWNSERKAGMLIIGYRRIAENMSKKQIVLFTIQESWWLWGFQLLQPLSAKRLFILQVFLKNLWNVFMDIMWETTIAPAMNGVLHWMRSCLKQKNRSGTFLFKNHSYKMKVSALCQTFLYQKKNKERKRERKGRFKGFRFRLAIFSRKMDRK